MWKSSRSCIMRRDKNSYVIGSASDVYCHGELLHTIQMAGLHADSKTFVDMKLRYKPEIVQNNFFRLMQEHADCPPYEDVLKFVSDHFEPPGAELEVWNPEDWIESPAFLRKVTDEQLRSWGSSLNSFWKYLGRKVKIDVALNPDMYSMIYVPNPVIVPGGRFREFYYWDSYWIIKGLLLSEMYQTVRGMLQNFLFMVGKYGFVPNGGRIYYSERSQPPLLIPMVKLYVEETQDISFLRENMHLMESEFQYWMEHHTLDVTVGDEVFTLASYKSTSQGPRPESYREDYTNALAFESDEEKEEFYKELRAGAQSGWDFSSRWFVKNGSNSGNLTDLNVQSIIPVDLNSILYWNARILAEFYTMLREEEKATKYNKIASKWLEAVNSVLWDDDVGVWLDYDLINCKKRNYFSLSNIAPLWTKCYFYNTRDSTVTKVLQYLEKSQVLEFPGGVPTSLECSGEQWDFPNAWPPLQEMIITGLDETGVIEAQQIAYDLAKKWVLSNWKSFNETGHMFEKYNCSVFGGRGGGGEYDVQVGFGWTNGVILQLLHKYGDRLCISEASAS